MNILRKIVPIIGDLRYAEYSAIKSRASKQANKRIQKFREQLIMSKGIHKELKCTDLRYISVLKDLDLIANIFFLSLKLTSTFALKLKSI